MATPHPVYVHGVAATIGWADPALSLGDFIYRGVRAALADAGLAMAQMDSVVLASHDLIDGRSLSSMVTAPAAGAYLRDEIRLSEDGLAALSLAAARIEAGESEWSVVAAWGRASEGDFARTSRTSLDPATIQPFGLDEYGASALRLAAWLHRHPDGAADRQRAADRRRERAGDGPGEIRRVPPAAPLTEADMPVPADLIVVTIVGRAPAEIRVTGIGHGTDLTLLGDRDLPVFSALADAAAAACKAAGVTADGFDHYEIDGTTLADEALSAEAIGVAAPGQGFAALARDDRINRSGGGAAGWAYPANGLLRFVRACQAVRGAGEGSRTALVTGLSTVAGQVAVAVAIAA